jgi:hypothetical protein
MMKQGLRERVCRSKPIRWGAFERLHNHLLERRPDLRPLCRQ